VRGEDGLCGRRCGPRHGFSRCVSRCASQITCERTRYERSRKLLSEKLIPTGVVVGSSVPPEGQNRASGQLLLPSYTQVYRLAGGAESETWQLRFSCTGFQYVQISGRPDPAGPSLDDAAGLFRRSFCRFCRQSSTEFHGDFSKGTLDGDLLRS
jgi:hypothetical protein